MVQLPSPGNHRPAPEPRRKPLPPHPAAPVKVEIEDPLEDEHAPLDKRSRISPPFQQWSSCAGASMAPAAPPSYNLLEEPSPLGLRLRKSPSLLDLIQMRLSQADPSITSSENGDGEKKDLKSTAASSFVNDKMKASNFPVSLLRIGTWECVSRYEGDLVAKCYYAKHKLVWEVLEGGLKSKIEIQWSDITALKAALPENGTGTLDIVLARQPLFFRETNPQPRKHTLWQTTTDFTGGQASIYRRHFLQCTQGLLNKHFEKLIQCDPRLYALSRQPEIILESLYFEPRCTVFEDQDEAKCHGFDNMKDACASTISGFRDLGSPSVAPSGSTTSEATIGRIPDNVLRETPSPNSVMDTQVSEENTGKKTGGSKSSRCWDKVKVPVLGGSMSMSDLVNHIGHCISGQVGQVPSGNPFLSEDGSPNKDMLEDLAQHLLGDSQISSASDEKSLMTRVNSLYSLLQKDSATHQSMGDLAQYLLGDSQMSSASDEQSLMKRVNSLYCLLQKDSNTYQYMHIDNGDAAAGNYCSDDRPLSPPGPSERKQSFDLLTSERKPLFDLSAADDFNDASAYKQPAPSISRKESFGELLMHLPRITSLPQVLFNIAEDPENQAR